MIKKSEKVIRLIDNVPNKGHRNEEWIKVIIYNPFKKELVNWPTQIKKDLGSIITKLQRGLFVGEPDSKKMNSVSPGCFEIRLKESDGIFRVFYIIRTDAGILIFHGFKKKTQKTPLNEISTGKIRLRALLLELKNEKK